jgi:hypothetical protein
VELSNGLFRGFTLCLVITISACSTYSLPGSTPAPVPVEKEPDYQGQTTPPHTTPESVPRPSEPSVSSAYRPLLAKAEQATAQGDYEQALALLERAQRIDPDNAEIYLAMARTHDARGDSVQARATAERGLLYCASKSRCAALRGYVQ